MKTTDVKPRHKYSIAEIGPQQSVKQVLLQTTDYDEAVRVAQRLRGSDPLVGVVWGGAWMPIPEPVICSV